MTKERAAEMWPLVKAYSEGKTIQFGTRVSNDWIDMKNPDFSSDRLDYRIKPEPREIYFIWRDSSSNPSDGFFETRQLAEQWKRGHCSREYKKFIEVLE